MKHLMICAFLIFSFGCLSAQTAHRDSIVNGTNYNTFRYGKTEVVLEMKDGSTFTKSESNPVEYTQKMSGLSFVDLSINATEEGASKKKLKQSNIQQIAGELKNEIKKSTSIIGSPDVTISKINGFNAIKISFYSEDQTGFKYITYYNFLGKKQDYFLNLFIGASDIKTLKALVNDIEPKFDKIANNNFYIYEDFHKAPKK